MAQQVLPEAKEVEQGELGEEGSWKTAVIK